MQIVTGDKELLQWFLSLERTQEDNVDADLVDAIQSPGTSDVYGAAANTVPVYSQ